MCADRFWRHREQVMGRGDFEIVVWPWSSPGELCSPGELSGQEQPRTLPGMAVSYSYSTLYCTKNCCRGCSWTGALKITRTANTTPFWDLLLLSPP